MKNAILLTLLLQGCITQGGQQEAREIEPTVVDDATPLPDSTIVENDFSEPLKLEVKKTAVAPARRARPSKAEKVLPQSPGEQPAAVEEPAAMTTPPTDVVIAPAPQTTIDAPKAKRYAPDNSGRNKDYRSDEVLTPFDQSNDPKDIDITVAVRKGVLRHHGVSVNGQNVKIITRDGVVTLRGPVANDEERAWIADVARQVSGVVRVDDQISVLAH